MKDLGAVPDLTDDSILPFWFDQLRKARQWYKKHGDDPVPGVESNEGVCGGDARVARTRVPVWLLEQARRLGTSQAALLDAYPTLCSADLGNAWAYAQSHRDEIDEQIRQNEEG